VESGVEEFHTSLSKKGGFMVVLTKRGVFSKKYINI